MKNKQSQTRHIPKEKLRQILCVLIPYLLAASISTLIGAVTFKVRGIAPFGERSVLCMDLWGQYFSMYVNNKEAEGLSGLFYSWNGAFGFNNWVQSAYYCNSIFIFLFRFIPNHLLVKALDIFCLIKMALSSVTCLAFMRYKFKSQSPVLIAGAVAYSACAYMLAFMSQFMWTDSLFLAPLLLIGLERLIYEKKTVMYTLILAISIISSFYIGFAMCIFSVLYFLTNSILLVSLSKEEERKRIVGVKDLGVAALRFGVFSLLAGAISAAVVIPVGMGISNTIASEMGSPEKFEWYGEIVEVLRNLMPEQRLFLEYDGANLAVGIIVFLAVPIYFFNGSIRITERIANAVMTIFLFASLNCNVLNYMWHGFHFPNQLPGRWTFLFSLFLIMLSCKGLINTDKMSPLRTLGGCILGWAIFYFTVKSGDGYALPDDAWTKFAMLTVLIYAVCVLAYLRSSEPAPEEETEPKPQPFIKRVLFNKAAIQNLSTIMVAFLMVLDVGKSFVTVSQYEGSKGLQVAQEDTYVGQLERASNNGRIWKCGKDEFYRVEANNAFTFNASMIGNYHGMRYYSSTMNGNIFYFLRYLGNRVYADKVSSVYTLSSPVQNSLFGLKYVMDFDRYLDRVLPGTVIVEDNEDGLFRENTTALPLAYAVSDDMLEFEVKDEIRALQTQNELVNRMCGEQLDPYQLLEMTSLTTEHVTLEDNPDWEHNFFHTESGQTQAIFHYTCTIPEGGCIFFEHNFRAGNLHITAPNVDKEISHRDGRFAYVGRLQAGDTVNIDVTVENIMLGCHGLNLYRMDEQVWDRAFRKLDAQGLDVTHFDNTRVDGTIALENESLVFTSIPNDGGWSVYCDGQKMPITTLCNSLVAVRLPEGEHKISFRYHVPGFRVGLAISLAGLLLTFGLSYFRQIREYLKKKK